MLNSFLNQWSAPILLLIASLLAGYAARRTLYRLFHEWFLQTETKLDELLLRTLKPHIIFWFFLGGVVLAARFSPLAPHRMAAVDRLGAALFFLSASIAAAKFTAGLARVYSQKLALPLPTTTLTENLIQGFVVTIGVLLVLANLGVSITPILTALGIGSLAVALALQDTLTNLFAGIYIVINRQIRVGDYVRLETGQEGYITDIGWRSTCIQELANNIVLVPNAKLSQSIVTNFHRPEREMAVLVEVGVSHDNDLERVEKLVAAAAKQVQETVPGAEPKFEPFVRYHGFKESSIQFTVILRCQEFRDKFLLTHELVKLLHKRFLADGINLPYPQSVVHLRQIKE